MLPWKCCSAKPVQLFRRRLLHMPMLTKTATPLNSVSEVKHLVKNGFFKEALHLYRLLRASNIDPASLPIVYALKACQRLRAFHDALSIHTFISKAGLLHQSVTFTNSLIAMYGSFTRLTNARQVFDEMLQRNIVSWNLMISVYASCGQPLEALHFCCLMKNNGVALDAVGFKIVLPICGQINTLRVGESVHCHLLVSGYCNNTALSTAIFIMYAKCGALVAAEKVFSGIVFKDVVSWNAMITCYSHARKYKPALKLLSQMLSQGHEPTRPTMLLSLQACTQLSALKMGMAIHGRTLSNGLYLDISIQGLLVDMYSKCGQLSSACRVFGEVTGGKVNTWSCMINGLGIHGYSQGFLMLFFLMLKLEVMPDGACFLIMLSSCSHWGLTEVGWKLFNYMFFQFGIAPSLEHWATMVDLMGRYGCINESVGLMKEMMPFEPDSGMVGAFLGSCRIHGNWALGKEIGDWLVKRGCVVAGFYKLLVGISVGEEQWKEIVRIRQLIEEKRMRGSFGTSLIEVSS